MAIALPFAALIAMVPLIGKLNGTSGVAVNLKITKVLSPLAKEGMVCGDTVVSQLTCGILILMSPEAPVPLFCNTHSTNLSPVLAETLTFIFEISAVIYPFGAWQKYKTLNG